VIILNASEADQVRGETTDGAALDPIKLADGVTFVLPEAVLTDPAHESKRAFLATLPMRVVGANEYAQAAT